MSQKKGKIRRRLIRVLTGTLIILFGLIIVFRAMVVLHPPDIENIDLAHLKRVQLADDCFTMNNDWLKKSNSGLWEMYISGKPFERGVKAGILSKELVQDQEAAFIKMINEMIPNAFYLNFLKYFVAWFNKDLDDYIPPEYQKEIYGISLNASPDFDFIGNKYQRILNYHAAHDIGHAVQNLNLVGCTSFGVWDDCSADSSLIIGRNFDFYAGEEFAKEKIVLFVHPEKGYDFATVTWGGFIGAVSGMNMKGLTVTINAAKSDIPYGAKTPVSIVARTILQYASNIEEAFEIAKGHNTFVSETFLIGSASDNRAAIIEKSLDTTVLFSQNKNYTVATNHFQDKAFSETKLNIENRANETSSYRYERVDELLNKFGKLDFLNAAELLRDQKGLGDKDIGMTNEKSINQFVAHHSVIFKPEERLMWVSTQPYQLGAYICYDLNKVFSGDRGQECNKAITVDSLEIPADPFLLTETYTDLLYYKQFVSNTNNNKFDKISENELKHFIGSNPEYYFTYNRAGDYYQHNNNRAKSVEFYNFALQKEISSRAEREKIIKKLNDTGN
jgi:predicted choloylglycine hydrolase